MKEIVIKSKTGKRIIFSEFEVKQRGGKWVVLAHDGSVRGTHDTEEAAKRQVRAIYANWKHESLINEAGYTRQDIVNNISAVFEYLLYAKFEKTARNNFLSPNTEEAALMLRQPETRKNVFSYLAGSLMRIVKDVMVSTFSRRYKMPPTEFERYFDLKTILSYLAPGKGGTIPAETPEEPVQTQTQTTPKKTIDLSKQSQGSYIGEALDEFNPDEEGWLQKQFDQIEKELADVTLPDPPTDKQKDDALKPVDSRDSYVSEKCDKTKKKKKLRKKRQIHKTEEKGKAPLTVDGYESPPPGDIPEKERRILANAYASARKKGYSKERASKQAWGAVHNYRNGKKK